MTAPAPADLVGSLDPLFQAAARRVLPAFEDELTAHIWCAWLELYQADPSKALDEVASSARAYIYARGRALNWLAHEKHEPASGLESLVEAGAAVGAVEWEGAPPGEHTIGQRVPGTYVASEREAFGLFDATARRSKGQLDALDLVIAFETAPPATRLTIRQIASGYAASEVGASGYRRAQSALRRALIDWEAAS